MGRGDNRPSTKLHRRTNAMRAAARIAVLNTSSLECFRFHCKSLLNTQVGPSTSRVLLLPYSLHRLRGRKDKASCLLQVFDIVRHPSFSGRSRSETNRVTEFPTAHTRVVSAWFASVWLGEQGSVQSN